MTDSLLNRVPAEFRPDIAALPLPLRQLLDDELAAGNTIVTVGHHFPAPPVGAFVMLANVVTTRVRASGDGIDFYERNNSEYLGEFHDAPRHFFILEPPAPPAAEPDMDAIRSKAFPQNDPPPSNALDLRAFDPQSPLARFDRSRIMDFDKWHDGTGHDLDVLREMTDDELALVVSSLTPPSDWRDVEALDVISSLRAPHAQSVTPTITSTPPAAMPTPMLVDAPASTDSTLYEPLGYIEAYDAVLNGDYAFVAYRETSRGSGEWCVRIKGLQTAGAVFEPEAMRLQARAAGAQGRPFFVWGFNMEPSAGDPRQVEFRVHVADGAPASIEMVLCMRKADHSAGAPKSVSFAWPAA